jgi:hypothetical protein
VMFLSFIFVILVVILNVDNGFWLAFLMDVGLWLSNHVKYYLFVWVYSLGL